MLLPCKSIHRAALAAAPDLALLPRIEYAYDPLPAQPVLGDLIKFPLLDKVSSVKPGAVVSAIHLDVSTAGLPYRSSLDHVVASRHWKANLKENVRLLVLLAADTAASDIEVKNGITLAKLARATLAPGHEHRIILATHYMFPYADEERIKQIAALMIIYFIFDDKIEETPNEELQNFRDDFLFRLDGHCGKNRRSSALQNHIDSIIHGIEAEDLAGGDGGRGMMQALRDAFRCVRPEENRFRSVTEYLDFRRLNVGAAFVVAAAKFSIKSSVNTADPRYSRFLDLVSDHLGLVNDLASYDKELRAFELDEETDMINLVHVIKVVTGLKSTDGAKAVVWALQLQIEHEMMAELEHLKSSGNVTQEEWRFLEAVTATATGNVMFCMTTSRYGGEAAKI